VSEKELKIYNVTNIHRVVVRDAVSCWQDAAHPVMDIHCERKDGIQMDKR
jgi:hypothetical protein